MSARKVELYNKLIRYAQLRQARAAVRDTSEFNYVYDIRGELTTLITLEMKEVSEEIKFEYELQK
jgi:hypothetical protein